MDKILSIRGISKRYGGVQALKDFSLEIKRGMVYGILGPNGSGKSTTLGIVLGIINQDGGSYEWFDGQDPANARKKIGALLETPNFYPYMSAAENLKVVARIKDVPVTDIDRVLEATGLIERKDSQFKGFSLGMKQRLAMAATLLGDPEVLVLDEPANGLDPQGIAEVRDLVNRLSDSGKTILMASHIIDEVEKVCDQVVVLKAGELLTSGPVVEVLSQDDTYLLRAADLGRLRAVLADMVMVTVLSQRQEGILIRINGGETAADLNERLHGQGISLSELRLQRTSLESKFLELVS